MEKKTTLVSLVKPSDQNHKRYVDTTADGNINDIQTVKMKNSHHTYKPGLVCFWCVAESCWETTDGRWKRGFYHTNKHCFPQTCCSSTLRTNLLRSLQDINSHLNVKLQLCVMKFQKGYGPIVQSFLHRLQNTLVDAYKNHLKKKQFICRFLVQQTRTTLGSLYFCSLQRL